MLDNTNYRVPPNANQPKQVTLGGFLITVYAIIGMVVGSTWPVWLAIAVAL